MYVPKYFLSLPPKLLYLHYTKKETTIYHLHSSKYTTAQLLNFILPKMDLLADIGYKDQLISAREENKLLKERIEDMKEKLKTLTVENATLLAEVEMYRKEAALSSLSKLTLKDSSPPLKNSAVHSYSIDFAVSGNGAYPTDAAVSLVDLHGNSNLLCTALDSTDTILATGGADGTVAIMCWGSALSPSPSASLDVVHNAAKIRASAPVIQISFSHTEQIIAVGCMDGSVHFIGYSVWMGKIRAWNMRVVKGQAVKFSKYVKGIAWSSIESIVACSSSDGTAKMIKISISSDPKKENSMDLDYDLVADCVTLEEIRSFHFNGAIESVCFVKDGTMLVMYERDTSYLTYFDLKDDFKVTTYSVNGNVNGGYDAHVSFAILQLVPSPNGKYLCLATDASRNIIMEVGTSNIIRDLYGHKNDGFSNPRVAWSKSGQYIFGNTQEDCSLIVWDVSSAKIVALLKGHDGQLRDIFSSKLTDIVVTASFDKTCRVWLNEM